MGTFLYYSIVLYIKGKHKNAKLPKEKDEKFQRKIIEPLRKWLLKYKIVSPHGLTYQEFDMYFPTWIREYVKGQNSGLESVGVESLGGGSSGSGSGGSGGGGSGGSNDKDGGGGGNNNNNNNNNNNKSLDSNKLGGSSLLQQDKQGKQRSQSSASSDDDNKSLNSNINNNNYKNIPKSEWSLESLEFEKKIG